MRTMGFSLIGGAIVLLAAGTLMLWKMITERKGRK